MITDRSADKSIVGFHDMSSLSGIEFEEELFASLDSSCVFKEYEDLMEGDQSFHRNVVSAFRNHGLCYILIGGDLKEITHVQRCVDRVQLIFEGIFEGTSLVQYRLVAFFDHFNGSARPAWNCRDATSEHPCDIIIYDSFPGVDLERVVGRQLKRPIEGTDYSEEVRVPFDRARKCLVGPIEGDQFGGRGVLVLVHLKVEPLGGRGGGFGSGHLRTGTKESNGEPDPDQRATRRPAEPWFESDRVSSKVRTCSKPGPGRVQVQVPQHARSSLPALSPSHSLADTSSLQRVYDSEALSTCLFTNSPFTDHCNSSSTGNEEQLTRAQCNHTTFQRLELACAGPLLQRLQGQHTHEERRRHQGPRRAQQVRPPSSLLPPVSSLLSYATSMKIPHSMQCA